MSKMLVLMPNCSQPAGLSGSLDHWVDGIVCHCLSAHAIIESRMEDVKPPFKSQAPASTASIAHLMWVLSESSQMHLRA